jgi:hypothetical protein
MGFLDASRRFSTAKCNRLTSERRVVGVLIVTQYGSAPVVAEVPMSQPITRHRAPALWHTTMARGRPERDR